MLIDTLVQLIGMVPYVIGVVLFIAGAPDCTSRYDAATGAMTTATTDEGRCRPSWWPGGLLALLGFAA